MKCNALITAMWLFWGLVFTGFAQDTGVSFRPAVFWGDNSDKGVLVVSPNEMVLIDSKGKKHGSVAAKGAVSGAYISPDGKKLAYTTASGVWLAILETGETRLVSSGYCDYLRWNNDGLGFLFTIYEKNDSGSSDAYGVKFFMADGDGKNMKQVYP
ncbi:MAG: hypothetical protein A2074_08160 [Candidatus Aquicultor primus]|uniref:S9 family peptidase n=1 Tax=Candidatus Aquicultor primus TaxID=1797195 RepID=A0A1F2UNZ7_9ACTN|nr:MAG: hypothetical protein A2074_08160 [Candidatus Aquicultor primus]